MEESHTLQHMVLVQRSHELLCPDCDACITHHVILRKRKREIHGPSTSKVAAAGTDSEEEEDSDSEDDDPDDTIPQVLLEQETHDIFCPVCEFSITHEVILQKRKRNSVEPFEEVGRLGTKIPEDFGNRQESSSTGFARDIFEDVAEADIDEIYMRSVLHQQKTFDLLCPECEACITHQLIFQKRKRAVSRSTSDSSVAESIRRVRQAEITSIDHDDREEFRAVKGFRREDPPLKRQRKSLYAGGPAGADEEEDELRRILSEQTTNDLACPDCNSLITREVIIRRKVRRLKSKASEFESEGSVLYQDKRDRLPFDKNPWKTRYKRFYRRLRGMAAAADEPENPQTRAENYGTVTNGSLTEPLLPDQKSRTAVGRYQGMRESFSETWRNSLVYFATLLFLWFVWLSLHYI